MRRTLLVIVVLGLLGLAATVPLRGQDSPSAPAVRGASDAALVIVEFSDFQCPYCAGATAVLDSLFARHGDRVRLEYRHFPLPMHEHAARAAQASVEAARQGAFWRYHDLLFARQERLTDADLVGYADSLGMDAAAFARALEAGTHEGAVQQDVSLGVALAVTGTPTFFVNGYRLVGVPPLWVFEEALEAFEEGLVEPRPLEPPDSR